VGVTAVVMDDSESDVSLSDWLLLICLCRNYAYTSGLAGSYHVS